MSVTISQVCRSITFATIIAASSISPANGQNTATIGQLSMMCNEDEISLFIGACNGFVQGVRQAMVLFGYACVPTDLMPTDITRTILPLLETPRRASDDAAIVVAVYLRAEYPC